MIRHHGQTVEYIVRKNGYSITELAGGLGVNRRTVYNYFRNNYLKYEVIHKIGLLVRHDFSKEFPEVFNSDQFKAGMLVKRNQSDVANPLAEHEYWKDKYIQLLEQYNQLISTAEPVSTYRLKQFA